MSICLSTELPMPPFCSLPDVKPAPETIANDKDDKETIVVMRQRSAKPNSSTKKSAPPKKDGKNIVNAVQKRIMERRERLCREALSYRGSSYSWGGSTWREGFDCSGLTRFLYLAEGIALPHSAKLQYRLGQPVTIAGLKPGDLVFFNTTRGLLTHVGMYIGNDKFIHASNEKKGVRIDSLSNRRYKSRFAGARKYTS